MIAPLFLFCALLGAAAPIRFERLPDGGIQPQTELGEDGSRHLLWFKGDPMGGDIYYARQAPGAKSSSTTFSTAVRVNAQPGSAIAAGTMRGPQMAVGRGGRVHVAWMGGSGAAKPTVAGERVTPMLYARMRDNGAGFEPEKNLITHAAGLDGGGTVAADRHGRVYVLWHGHEPGREGEENRGVYLARSTDDGQSFAPERLAASEAKGACACCGMKATTGPAGELLILFRAAPASSDRPQTLLVSRDRGDTFHAEFAQPWNIATCPASTAFLARASSGLLLGAWETEGNAVWASLDPSGRKELRPVAAQPGSAKKKFPAVAENSRGEVLLVWNEPAGWGQEGRLGWELYRQGQRADSGSAQGIPAWSYAVPIAGEDGQFAILY